MSFKIQIKPFTMLSVPEIVDLAARADANFEKTSKVIERLRRDEEAQRSAIANRWKNVRVANSDRQRLASEETAAAMREIRVNAEAELDGYMRKAVDFMNQGDEQGPLYVGPQQILERAHLGEQRRSEYVIQLQGAGPVGLARIAQVAVGTKNHALAAAVLTVLDRMPSTTRPFSPLEFAEAMQLEDWSRVANALKVIRNRGQSTINTIRAFRTFRGGMLGPGLADAFARLEEDSDSQGTSVGAGFDATASGTAAQE